MWNHLKYSRKLIIVAALCIVVAAGIFAFLRLGVEKTNNSVYESMQGWQSISGRWTEHRGVFSNSNYGRGDMLIAQHSQGANYTIAADVRFDLLFPETHYGDAGLVVRTTDPEQGVDSYQGYYAGLRPDEQTIILGRASYDWHQLESAKLATPVVVGAWYHLELSAKQCSLTVTVSPLAGGQPTRIAHEDPHCLTQGVAGLRSFYAQASWRNMRVTQN
jgi:hypothetical protein